ncbi:uncharacterized protein STEHIDRAFT_22547, partial [Stereum hirsutum FP-91666 SS1]|uniref:uncharacterized protein n=1 Tax=Stereum hirsutum (strain FP-91666) TaxID=721885 RepID=UPI000444A0E7
QKEEDLARAKERMEMAISDLDSKLTVETRNRDLVKDRADASEQDARQAKEQLAEMGRTATEYSNMIKRKEGDVARLTADLDALKTERSQSSKEMIALQVKVETLTAEIQARRDDKERDASTQAKLHEELDELRALMEAKSSEDERRSEVEKRKDEELVDLRAQTSSLQQDLSDLRRSTLEAQNKMRVELETSTKEH